MTSGREGDSLFVAPFGMKTILDNRQKMSKKYLIFEARARFGGCEFLAPRKSGEMLDIRRVLRGKNL